MAKKNRTKSMPARVDVHQVVTDQIAALLEKGVRPWVRSWDGPDADAGVIRRPLRFNGQPYQGINVLILWFTAVNTGYTSPHWMTFKQAESLGGRVRNGEHGIKIVFYSRTTVARDTLDERDITLLRSYSVFNAEQIDGLPDAYQPQPTRAAETRVARIPHAEVFFEALGAEVRHGGARAFYMISQDRVQLPNFADFRTADDYYSTRGHEMVHWTQHQSRLNRTCGGQLLDRDGYAVEELIAELGAAFLAADLGLAPHLREDHASYLDHWLHVLKSDKNMIFKAASEAEKAVKFLHRLAYRADTTADDFDELIVP